MNRRGHHPAASLLIALIPLGVTFAAPPSANVVVFDGPLLESARPRVIDSRLVPGYVTSVGVYDGSEVTVQRLDPSAGSGFAAMDPLAVALELAPPPGQYTITGNQLSPMRAVSFFGEPGIYDPLGVQVDPPGGSHESTIRLRFFAPDATTTIQYSVDGGPMNDYAGEDIFVAGDATIAYQGKNGETTGPLKVAVYTVQFPDCTDVDQDLLPDRIELSLGLNPLLAQGDLNGNLIDDFDEFIRGADAFQPNDPGYIAPLMVDSDGDKWSDYDEGLRQTDPGDATSFPVAPGLRTVEILRSGSVESSSGGGSPPPPNPVPGKPYPASFVIETVTPGGTVIGEAVESNDGSWSLRSSGERFLLHRARALDGSGRVLLALSPPAGLCIDASAFCGEAWSPDDWRQEWKVAYEALLLRTATDIPIDPRSTAEALLLNRHYEVAGEDAFVPGDPLDGPFDELTQGLRARRNDAALYTQIAASVTPAMIDLVADYYRFHTSPGRKPMLALLADHFAGRAVPPELIPAGVRTGNIATVAGQTQAFIAAVPPAEALLAGTISLDETGFLVTVGGTTYRLEKLAESFVPGTTVTLRALVDLDNCGFDPVPALVTEVVSRGLAPLPPIVDTDQDGLGDDWELFFFGNLAQAAGGDFDGDGYSNGGEYAQGMNPKIANAPAGVGWFLY